MSFKIGDEVVSTKELFLSIGTKGRVLGCDGHYILVYFKSGVLDSGGNELLSSIWLTDGIEKIQKKEEIEVGDSVRLYNGEILKVIQKNLTNSRVLLEALDASRFWCDITNISLYKKQGTKK